MDFKTKGFIASLAVCGGILLGTTNANADTYTVQNGDTLSAVAQKTNTSVETLANINHIADVNEIAVGQKIETDYVETDEYVVQSGDTLSAIALKYGVSVEEIKNANGLSSDLLLVGQFFDNIRKRLPTHVFIGAVKQIFHFPKLFQRVRIAPVRNPV